MLSERERRTLAGIEQQLATSDPEFVRIFHAPARRRVGRVLPRLLLVLGLSLMVVGSVVVSVPVAAVGVGLSLVSLGLACQRTGGTGPVPAT